MGPATDKGWITACFVTNWKKNPSVSPSHISLPQLLTLSLLISYIVGSLYFWRIRYSRLFWGRVGNHAESSEKCPSFEPAHSDKLGYEGCSNMNASSFITFFTYMLRQNAIPFWKELFVAFRMAPQIENHSLYFSSCRPLYKGHSCILIFFLKQIAMHVLVHVRI